MHHIKVYQFGFAIGTTIVIIYIGCILTLTVISTETAVGFLNNIMHSIDVTAIMRKTPIPFLDALIGVVEWFIIGWLIGATIAASYNACNRFHKTT